MTVRKPSDRHCYAIQTRRYVHKGEVVYSSQTLHEFTRREWRDIEALQGPVLDRYRQVWASEAHKWVKTGGHHSTGLWTDDGRIRYAESDPMMEEAA